MTLNALQRAGFRKHQHTTDQLIDPDTGEAFEPGGPGGAHPNLATHEALGLATDDDLDGKAAVGHNHDSDYAEIDHEHEGGSGNVSGQTGDSIEIPGLSASPDRYPASPSLLDDEFDSDTSADWTTLGTLEEFDINTFVKSHMRLRSAQGALRVDGKYKACPALPFTVTVKLTDMLCEAIYHSAGMFIAEAAPGEIYALNAYFNNGSINASRLPFSDPTTYAGGVQSVTIGTVPFDPLYMRMIVADHDDVTIQLSRGGVYWWTFYANLDPGFTVGSVGLWVNGQGVADEADAVFDWIRFE